MNTLVRDAELIGPSSTYDDLDRIFASPGEHQFTVEHENHTYVCMAYRIGLSTGYYVVFRDDLFSLIRKRPGPFGYTDDEGNWRSKKDAQGRNVSDYQPWDTQEKIDLVLASTGLSSAVLKSSISSRYRTKKSIFEANLGPPFIVLGILGAPIFVPGIIHYAIKDRRLDNLSQQFAQKYDPLKIKLGMSVAEVDALLGSAARESKGADGSFRRLYQEPAMDEVKLWRRGECH